MSLRFVFEKNEKVWMLHIHSNLVHTQQEGFSRVQTVQKEIFLHTARLLRVHLKSVVVYLTYSKFKICVPIRYMPKYILLTDYFTSEAETFATAQVNMKGRRMAYWIFNLSEIVELITQQGYKKIYETKNHQPIYNFSNTPISNDSRNLLFSRNK